MTFIATADLTDCSDLERVIASLPLVLVDWPCVERSLSTLRFSLSPSTDIRAMGLNRLLLLLLVRVMAGKCSIGEVLLGSIWNREERGKGEGEGERERGEKERGREREGERKGERGGEREREREGEREGEGRERGGRGEEGW